MTTVGDRLPAGMLARLRDAFGHALDCGDLGDEEEQACEPDAQP